MEAIIPERDHFEIGRAVRVTELAAARAPAARLPPAARLAAAAGRLGMAMNGAKIFSC